MQDPRILNPSSTPLIELCSLSKAYGSDQHPIPVLHEVDLKIEATSRIALLGKSGSGKSTLMNILGGLDVPSSGNFFYRGRDVSKFDANQRAEYRLRSVGMIFQSFYLIPTQSALENVELPMIFAGIPQKFRRESAVEALAAVGLADRMSHRPNQLSGGERQRVAIARALVNHPEIILADEPTGNLDSVTGQCIIDLLLSFLEEHRSTLVIVTHDEDLAQKCATRILRMNDGRIVSGS